MGRHGAVLLWMLAVGVGMGAAGVAAAHGDAAARVAEDPGPELLFELPEPGSYELPVIADVAEHVLLDASGERASLPGLADRQLAVIAFIYGGCADARGCPLALAELRRLDRALVDDERLAGRVRLAAVSFDPERDRPEQMRQLREQMQPRGDWRFLTTAGPAALRPILEDYGQDVLPAGGGPMSAAVTLRHVLKIFLVDSRRQVRNIYSSGFLSWRIVLADLRTLSDPAAAP